MIKEVEERQMSLEMRLPNLKQLYFYEASLIVMRAAIRYAHRYAELAREMAAKEKDESPQGGTPIPRGNLREGSREPGSQSAGGHTVPLPVSHHGGTRADWLRLLSGLSRSKP